LSCCNAAAAAAATIGCKQDVEANENSWVQYYWEGLHLPRVTRLTVCHRLKTK